MKRYNTTTTKLISCFYHIDQDDRMGKDQKGLLMIQDTLLDQIAKLLVRSKSPLPPKSKFQIAMMLHHTAAGSWIAIAQQLAHSASEEKYSKASWLYAAIFDRRLILKGKPQYYGTQFKINQETGEATLQPLSGLCTDSERAQLGLPTEDKIIQSLKNFRRS